MQYQRFPDKHLEPLPAQHVDTGMGLERICRVLQQVDSNYSTDLFVPILGRISEVTGTTDKSGEIGVAYRVIADHLRSLSFAIADGAIPSNEGRGYVLRRMLRRATRFGRVLGMEKPFMHQLVGTLSEVMGDAFPELSAQQKHIEKVIESEESSFGQTLDRGLEIFEQMASSSRTSENGGLSGEDAFKLYDTYGFPVDLTRLMCDERRLNVDEMGFENLMEEQRTRAREAGKFRLTLDDWTEFKEGESEFVGYSKFQAEAEVLRYSSPGEGEWQIILDQTPFYAESGGQVGDLGMLRQNGRSWRVTDVQKQGGSIVHYCKGPDAPESGYLEAMIDPSKRLQVTNNHSATHLMLAAMREILGTHVTQAGSIVHPEYLRFDFTHPEKPTQEEMEQIESRVNDKIRENIETEIYQTEYQKAIDSGIVAMFGEKYGDVVRVIKMGDFSEELCGGCHVPTTGQIGHFRLVSEEGIASGIRRFVGVTGIQAESISQQENRVAQNLRQQLNVPVEKISETVEKLLDEKRTLEKELQEIRKQNAGANAGTLLEDAQTLGDVRVLAKKVDVQSMDEFRSLADSLRKQFSNGVAWLATEIDGKSSLICIVSDEMLQRGLKAGELVNAVASLADGKGGGKPHMAQAGIRAPQLLPEALNMAPDLLKQKLGL
jgi:alanyl-tRNA synthetase